MNPLNTPFVLECHSQIRNIEYFERNVGSISIEKIELIQERFDRVRERYWQGNQYDSSNTNQFWRSKEKVENFFKNYTVLIHVNHDTGFGNNLFLVGSNGDWNTGYRLDIKNSCDWSIRIPKPQGDNSIYYKIVKKHSNNHREWQPGENRIILSDYQEVSHRVTGEFSLPESHSEQITYDNHNQNEMDQHFGYHPYMDNNNNNNNNDIREFHTHLNNISSPNTRDINSSFNSRFSQIINKINSLFIENLDQIINTNRNLENNTNSNQNNVNIPQEIKKIKLEIPGTVKYLKGNIPETVREKAKEIERLKDLFYEMDSDIKIPNNFECSVMQEIMALPLFVASHPEVQKDPSNHDARHSMDSSSFEKLFEENKNQNQERSYNFLLLNCPVCRHPENGNINRDDLLIDTGLQDEILKFLEEHTKK